MPCKLFPRHAVIACWFLCIFQLFCYNPSPCFPSHMRMLKFVSALNLTLNVAPSAPIIANYLLQPQATCRLASSYQTLLFSRQGCEVHQKQHSYTLNILNCHSIWVRVTALCQESGEEMFRCWQVFVNWPSCHHFHFCDVEFFSVFSEGCSSITWEVDIICISLIFRALNQFWLEACLFFCSVEVKAGV